MKNIPRLMALAGLALSLSPSIATPWVAGRQDPEGFATLRRAAERQYERGSYTLAQREYERASSFELTSVEERWVAFRLADCAWRAAAKTNEADTTMLERARVELERLGTDPAHEEDRDLVWAEANESLGAFFWARPRSRDWGSGWPRYERALGYWGASSDLDVARRRYLDIVFEIGLPGWDDSPWSRGNYASYLSLDILRNAARIAREPADVAATSFLLGMGYTRHGRNLQYKDRVEEAFGQVLALGRDSEWYDDALFRLANHLQHQGRAHRGEGGNWTWEPDFVQALALYKRLLNEFEKGETHWYDAADTAVREITEESVWLSVNRFFLPGSDVVYDLGWRNVERVELALYATNLTNDPDLSKDDRDWLASVRLHQLEPVRRWTFETEDDGTHRPGSKQQVLEEPPSLGAYVLEARAGGQRARALVLVSDVALTTKATSERILAWLTDVETGEPVSGARLHLWQWFYSEGRWRVRQKTAETGADGTHLFELGATESGTQYFIAAAKEGRQTYAQSGAQGSPGPSEEWRIYAYTDRSTYRPGDTLKWKIVARRYDGRTYATPSGETLQYYVTDARGADWKHDSVALDEFGVAFGELETAATDALGEYAVRFLDEAGRHVGNATLFRIEEYKLPEFEVSVGMPEDEDGQPKRYVLGDVVEARLEASYYFGGPVAGAKVEVFVYQRPFWHEFPTEHEFPWLHEGSPRRWWGGQGSQVSHQILSTDDQGFAGISFETPFEGANDLEYTVEARVTDASRREITSSSSVRVTRTEYFADVRAQHAIHTPGAPIELEVRALDANGNPVSVEGNLEVTRERWVERWRDPEGRLEERAALQDGRLPDGWNLVFRGYERDVVAETSLRTSEDGVATWTFRPERDGTYSITWKSIDAHDTDVTARTNVFVADEATRELGYLPGGIEILIDEDTLEVGEDAVFLVTAPASGRWALLSLEAESLHRYEVVHLDGSVKLMRFPMTEAETPNVWLRAASFHGSRAFQDTVELVVPPTKEFLDVEITHDDDLHAPGTEGEVTILVRDHSGEPARVQLSVAVVDASLAYVQGDYAGDPRRFFHGTKRGLRVSTFGSHQHAGYSRLDRNEDEKVARDFDDGELDAMGIDYRMAKDEGQDGFFLGRGSKAMGERRQAVNAPSSALADQAAGPMEQLAAGTTIPEDAESVVRVRSDFREVALWRPNVVTGDDGIGRLKLTYPDSTTRWTTTVRAVDMGTRVGSGTAETRTRQPLIARLQAPRFFVVGDEVTLSGNLNNNTEVDLGVRASLEIEGLELLGRMLDGELLAAVAHDLVVPANGQLRVDWRVRAVSAGGARVVLRAVGAEIGDAVERRYPVHAHGIEALVATSGRFEDGSIAFPLELPAERDAATTRFVVQVTPSLAVTMLDALPYLADYPYGCTEQTLSRFLPATIVARTLRDLGLEPGDAMTRVFGGIEGEFVDRTQPKGKQALDELDRMTGAGLDRLYDFQHADGGWSWWKHGESDHFMTAYVLWGLSLARDSGLEVRSGVLESAARYLAREIVEREWQPDLQAWMLHALAVHGSETGDPKTRQWVGEAFENLWQRKDAMNAYGRALFALAAHALGRGDEARQLIDNLVDGVIVDTTPDTSIVRSGSQSSRDYVLRTAHWGNDGIWHRWHDGAVESTAFALRALVAIAPEHELVEQAANWLVQNRRGAQWSNTRDTAITVLALNDYLKSTSQLAGGCAFRVMVNGHEVGSVELSADDLLRAPSEFSVDPELLVEGANRVEIEKLTGEGPLYFAARATFFSLEEPIPARGNQIFVRRQYYKLVGRPTLLQGTVYDRVLLEDGDAVASGERIQVVLTVEAKNDLEYILFQDLKPGGFESLQVRSGESMSARELRRAEIEQRLVDGRLPRDARGSSRASAYTNRSRSVHQELRDREVALFVDRLEDGFWELSYDLRAEAPGVFHALPLLAQAMYVPEIRANGEELRVVVRD